MQNCWTVSHQEGGKKLVTFIKEKLQSLSAKKIKALIERNRCRINQKVERFASFPVKTGDQVTFVICDESQKPLEILYEDTRCLVYNKTVGVVCDEEVFKPYHLVHRLDKETTGCFLLAKTSQAKELLDHAFKMREVQKEYLALVKGVPHQAKGSLRTKHALLLRLQGQGIWGEDPHGKEAVTDWECIEKGKSASLILCRPLTGRTHQVRVHMKALGHPIIGDYHYDRTPFSYPAERVMLHAEKLVIPSLDLAVQAPVPKDFLACKEALIK